MSEGGPGTIRWRLHLASPPGTVFDFLATDEGRARFWAESAVESGGVIAFRFADGTSWSSPVVRAERPRLYELDYLAGSRATFLLEPDGGGGTLLTLTERDLPEAERDDNRAGWVSLLLTLKAAVDFGADLRNRDPRRGWKAGFVDP